MLGSALAAMSLAMRSMPVAMCVAYSVTPKNAATQPRFSAGPGGFGFAGSM